MGDNTQRYAVVTGSNKGIGFEVVKQLASSGIKVVLTARDEKKGLEALETLKASGLSDFVVFHKVDVANAESVVALADFVKSQFGKLDILINNAGVNGTIIHDRKLAALFFAKIALSEEDTKKAISHTYETVKDCLKINYYGAKITTESFLPLLKLSDSPKIVNVSSILGRIKIIPNEWTKQVFSDVDNLTEEKVDEVLKKFLEYYKEGSLESNGWPPKLPFAYHLSKAAMNCYTRIIAKKYSSLCINSICPGSVKTDITANIGILTAEEGASTIVKLALLPHGTPSGQFYDQTQISYF